MIADQLGRINAPDEAIRGIRRHDPAVLGAEAELDPAAGLRQCDGQRGVRPAEAAGSYEGFRQMDRATRELPSSAAQLTAQAKTTYVSAIRDWVLRGADSEHAFSADQARAHLPALTEDMVAAQTMFRLGQFLMRHGEAQEGARWLREATRLHPDSWCLWRQQAGVNELGLAALPDFWERVDALGSRRYYAPVDMKGMP